jgi:hypothetical protein
MSPFVLAPAFAAGLGLAAFAACLLAAPGAKDARLEALVSRWRPRLKKPRQKVDRVSLGLLLAGGALLAGVAQSPGQVVTLFLAGAAVAAVLLEIGRRAKRRAEHNRRVKEIAVFFEALELYVRAGYALAQAMRAAAVLVPGIRKAVERCLDYWPSGPRKALMVLQRELGVPEAEILVSLLIQIEAVGMKDLEGVMRREARNLERLRRMRAEARLASRPVYIMVYRFLPLAATLAIVVGPMLFRTFTVMREAGISLF